MQCILNVHMNVYKFARERDACIRHLLNKRASAAGNSLPKPLPRLIPGLHFVPMTPMLDSPRCKPGATPANSSMLSAVESCCYNIIYMQLFSVHNVKL